MAWIIVGITVWLLLGGLIAWREYRITKSEGDTFVVFMMWIIPPWFILVLVGLLSDNLEGGPKTGVLDQILDPGYPY